jgi:hypothetical protein
MGVALTCLPMSRRSFAVIAATAAAAAGLLAAAPASARLTKAVADCNSHAQLTQSYTEGELRQALNTMPSDVKEYTNCYDVIQRQLLADIGKIKARDSGGGGGGSSFLPTPLLVVLGVLVLTAGGFAVIARRQR